MQLLGVYVRTHSEMDVSFQSNQEHHGLAKIFSTTWKNETQHIQCWGRIHVGKSLLEKEVILIPTCPVNWIQINCSKQSFQKKRKWKMWWEAVLLKWKETGWEALTLQALLQQETEPTQQDENVFSHLETWKRRTSHFQNSEVKTKSRNIKEKHC